jgi:hypothetical protein
MVAVGVNQGGKSIVSSSGFQDRGGRAETAMAIG